MAQADLAHAARLSLTTINRMETGQRLPHPGNRVLVIEALVRAMPLKDSEIQTLSRDLEIDAARIVQLQARLLRGVEKRDDPSRDALHRELEALLDRYGINDVEAGMIGFRAGLEVALAQRTANEERATLIHRSGPIARPDGGVEHIETEYVRTPPKKPTGVRGKSRERRHAG